MNVLELLRADGIVAKKAADTKGGEYHSPCPACGGRDRFHCWPAQNDGEGSWWCRMCDAGGDAIQYLIEFRGLDFKTAAQAVGRDIIPAARRTPAVRRPSGPRLPSAPAREPSEAWRVKAAKLVDSAHETLLRTPEALAYLAGRGLTEDAARRYRLGWLPSDVYKQRPAWGLPPKESASKPGTMTNTLWIPAGLVIPVYRGGQLHRVRIRRPKPGQFGPRKYYWVPGSGNGTYVLNPDARAFVVVEAELDAMLCDASTSADVGALGIGTLSAKPDRAVHKLLTNALCILNALDFDAVDGDGGEAKARAQAKLRQWWQLAYERAQRWPVPEGKDPGDAFALGVDIGAWIRAGLPPVMLLPPPKAQRPAPAPTAQHTPQASPAPALPANLPALERLLRETGIALTFGGSRPFVMPKELQGHDGILRRLKELCFHDDELGQYLDNHPAGVITAENLTVR